MSVVTGAISLTFFPQIQNCLEEYVDHGYQIENGVNFQGDKYRGIHQNFLEMINQIKMNNYHGAQIEAC